LRIENNVKGNHLFDEKYTTKRDKKTIENQDGDEREGLMVHAELLPGEHVGTPIRRLL